MEEGNGHCNNAASKIQAGFKGYKTRKNKKSNKEQATTSSEKPQEEVDIDLEDPEVQNAALKIQAGFQGMKARKEVHSMREARAGAEAEASKAGKSAEPGVDIDLEDPDVQRAATKIQASFKGYKTRKEFQGKKETSQEGAQPE